MIVGFLHIQMKLKKNFFICFRSYLKYISIYNFQTFIKRVGIREMAGKKKSQEKTIPRPETWHPGD